VPDHHQRRDHPVVEQRRGRVLDPDHRVRAGHRGAGVQRREAHRLPGRCREPVGDLAVPHRGGLHRHRVRRPRLRDRAQPRGPQRGRARHGGGHDDRDDRDRARRRRADRAEPGGRAQELPRPVRGRAGGDVRPGAHGGADGARRRRAARAVRGVRRVGGVPRVLRTAPGVAQRRTLRAAREGRRRGRRRHGHGDARARGRRRGRGRERPGRRRHDGHRGSPGLRPAGRPARRPGLPQGPAALAGGQHRPGPAGPRRARRRRRRRRGGHRGDHRRVRHRGHRLRCHDRDPGPLPRGHLPHRRARAPGCAGDRHRERRRQRRLLGHRQARDHPARRRGHHRRRRRPVVAHAGAAGDDGARRALPGHGPSAPLARRRAPRPLHRLLRHQPRGLRRGPDRRL
ncbi:MAG: sodium/calcium exchanger protein, partial [uncultured Actinomycetospora sp.]